MATLQEQIAMLVDKMEAEVVQLYTTTDTPVREITEKYSIGHDRLYHILHSAGVRLRQPMAQQIVVLDEDDGDTPTLVDRTQSTLALRDRQVQRAYYTRGEVVTHICNTFHISWRTLYRICPPNRRRTSPDTELVENAPSTLEPRA